MSAGRRKSFYYFIFLMLVGPSVEKAPAIAIGDEAELRGALER